MRMEMCTRILLKLAGLDKNKLYRCEENGEVYSGALLMNAGIDLTHKIARDGDSIKLYFTEVK